MQNKNTRPLWQLFAKRTPALHKNSLLAFLLFAVAGGISTLRLSSHFQIPPLASLHTVDATLQSPPQITHDTHGDNQIKLSLSAPKGIRQVYIRHVDFIWDAKTLSSVLLTLRKSIRITLTLQPEQDATGRVWALRASGHSILTYTQTCQSNNHARMLLIMLTLLLSALGGLGLFIVLQHLKARQEE